MFNCKGIFKATLLLGNLLLLAACQTLPLKGNLPDNLVAEKIAGVEENSSFSVSPDGNVVALVNSGLKLFHIPTREQIGISEEIPLKLAWSPYGSSLAALFADGRKSSIVVFDQYGTVFAKKAVDAAITDIGWLSETELAMGGFIYKDYKNIGGNYTSILYRWEPGHDSKTTSELRDVTLQPNTISRSRALLSRGTMMDFSGQTPLVSYFHPVDPPVYTPYYKLVTRDLASGREMEIANVSFSSQGARLSVDGEKILFSDGNGNTTLRNLWSEEVIHTVSTPGLNLALSPDSGYWFADGSLFRDGALFASLAPGAVAQFTHDGSRLVLKAGDELYLVKGIKAAGGTMFVPSLNEKIQKLRSLRAEGLISPNEYKESLKRIAQ